MTETRTNIGCALDVTADKAKIGMTMLPTVEGCPHGT